MSPLIRYLGMVDYQPTFEAMRAHNRAANESTPDEIWLLEHPSTFTQGLAGRPEHVLNAGEIPVVKIDRGGQVTYHGPGQLVVYLLLNMHPQRIAALGGKRGYGVKSLVMRIEQSLIDLLAEYGVTGVRQAGMPGVYIENAAGIAKVAAVGLPDKGSSTLAKIAAIDLPDKGSSTLAKIAAIGLRVANHATYHGLSLNIDMDLEPFTRINPCGYAGLATTQLSALGVRDNTRVVGEKLLTHLKANLYG